MRRRDKILTNLRYMRMELQGIYIVKYVKATFFLSHFFFSKPTDSLSSRYKTKLLLSVFPCFNKPFLSSQNSLSKRG